MAVTYLIATMDTDGQGGSAAVTVDPRSLGLRVRQPIRPYASDTVHVPLTDPFAACRHDRVSLEAYAPAHGGAVMKNADASSAEPLSRTWKARRGRCTGRYKK